MNLERIFASATNTNVAENPSANDASPMPQRSSIDSVTGNISNLTSQLPGGLMGGLAAGGVMALFLGSKSTRKMAKKVAKIGGTAVLGGLAYKAYGNWKNNKALGQTRPVVDHDIDLANQTIPTQLQPQSGLSLELTLLKAMVAAANSDGDFDKEEQRRLFSSVEAMNLSMAQKAIVFEIMSSEIPMEEIIEGVTMDEHKAEVYLAAYLAIKVDDQRERNFLNRLATALELPMGFAAYLEQQADAGIES